VSRLSLELSMRTLQVLPVVKKVCSVLRVEDPNL
jgi:homoserine dehydrogenase